MSTSNTPSEEIIELHLTQDELCTYALLAHEEGITLNEWFIKATLAYCQALDKETPDGKENSD